jgi:hypothetical protein
MNARYLDDDVTCVRQFGETTTAKIGALQNVFVAIVLIIFQTNSLKR